MEKSKTLEKPSEKSPTRLGRGLSALIPPSAAVPSPAPLAPPERGRGAGQAPEGASEVALADIRTNPNQPRTVFNQAAIDELAASIRVHGVLQPVMVRPRGGGGYELVAGERRYRAAQEAGLRRIPAVIRSLTDEESLTVALIENIQREDLNPIEAARAYKQLMDEYGLTQTQLGEQMGRQQSTISNALRLLHLPEEVQDSISDGRLTEAHGKALLSAKDPAKQRKVWQDAVARKLTVKETEQAVKETEQAVKRAEEAGVNGRSRPASVAPDVHWRDLQERLCRALGMKASLEPGAKGVGTMTVKFSGPEQLEELLERLRPL